MSVLTLPRPLDWLHRTASGIQRRGAMAWRAYPREILGAGAPGLVAAAAIAGTAIMQSPSSTAGAAPPAPPPMVVRAIAPDQAVKLNAEIPVAAGPNPTAMPFVFKGDTAARAQALSCLASAVYYESGNQ